ncbi:MAG: AI-2E family transporter [Acidobacteriota bacterium]|nr:AI-2E family transporter [Acidobacteriota bacterium]
MSLLSEILTTLANWLKGELQIIAILAALYTLGFALTGVPAWFLLGPVCALLHLVPIFGAPLGLILVLAATALAGRSFPQILAALAVWVLVEALEGFYLTPRILGKRTRLGPMAVFFGVIAASALFGPVGIFFAVPTMAVAMVIYHYFNRARTSAVK